MSLKFSFERLIFLRFLRLYEKTARICMLGVSSYLEPSFYNKWKTFQSDKVYIYSFNIRKILK